MATNFGRTRPYVSPYGDLPGVGASMPGPEYQSPYTDQLANQILSGAIRRPYEPEWYENTPTYSLMPLQRQTPGAVAEQQRPAQGLPWRAQFDPWGAQHNAVNDTVNNMLGPGTGLGVALGSSPGAQRGGAVEGPFGSRIATTPMNLANFTSWGREGLLAGLTFMLSGGEGSYQQTPGEGAFGQDVTRPEGEDRGFLDTMIDSMLVPFNAINDAFEGVMEFWRTENAKNRALNVVNLAQTGSALKNLNEFASVDFISSLLTGFTGSTAKFDQAQIEAVASTRGVDYETMVAEYYDLEPAIVRQLMANPNMTGDEIRSLVHNAPLSRNPAVNLGLEFSMQLATLLVPYAAATKPAAAIGLGAKAVGLGSQAARLGASASAALEAAPAASRALSTAGWLGRKALQINSLNTTGGWSIRGLEWTVKQIGVTTGNDALVDYMDRMMWEMPLSMNPGVNIVTAFSSRPLQALGLNVGLRSLPRRSGSGLLSGRIQIGNEGTIGEVGALNLRTRQFERPIYNMPGAKADDVVVSVAGQRVRLSPQGSEFHQTLHAQELDDWMPFFDRLGWDRQWLETAFSPDNPDGLILDDLRETLLYAAMTAHRDTLSPAGRFMGLDQSDLIERSLTFMEQNIGPAHALFQEELAGKSTAISDAIMGQWWRYDVLNDTRNAAIKGRLAEQWSPGEGFRDFISALKVDKFLRGAYEGKLLGADVAAGFRKTVNIDFLHAFADQLVRDYEPGDIVRLADLDRLKRMGGMIEQRGRGRELVRRGTGKRAKVPNNLTRKEVEQILRSIEDDELRAREAALAPPKEKEPAFRKGVAPDNPYETQRVLGVSRTSMRVVQDAAALPPEQLATKQIPADVAKAVAKDSMRSADGLIANPAEAWPKVLEWYTNKLANAEHTAVRRDSLDTFAVVARGMKGGDTRILEAGATGAEVTRDYILNPVERNWLSKNTATANRLNAASAALAEVEGPLKKINESPMRKVRLYENVDERYVIAPETPTPYINELLAVFSSADVARQVPQGILAQLLDPAIHPFIRAQLLDDVNLSAKAQAAVKRADLDSLRPVLEDAYGQPMEPTAESLAGLLGDVDSYRTNVEQMAIQLDAIGRRYEIIDGRGHAPEVLDWYVRLDAWQNRTGRNWRETPMSTVVADEQAAAFKASQTISKSKMLIKESEQDIVEAEADLALIRSREFEPEFDYERPVVTPDGRKLRFKNKAAAQQGSKDWGQQTGLPTTWRAIKKPSGGISHYEVYEGRLVKRTEAIQKAMDEGDVSRAQELNIEEGVARGGTVESGGAVLPESEATLRARADKIKARVEALEAEGKATDDPEIQGLVDEWMATQKAANEAGANSPEGLRKSLDEVEQRIAMWTREHGIASSMTGNLNKTEATMAAHNIRNLRAMADELRAKLDAAEQPRVVSGEVIEQPGAITEGGPTAAAEPAAGMVRLQQAVTDAEAQLAKAEADIQGAGRMDELMAERNAAVEAEGPAPAPTPALPVDAPPPFTRAEIQVGPARITKRRRALGTDGESVTRVTAPSTVTSRETWSHIDPLHLNAYVEARIDFKSGKPPKKTDAVWTVWGDERGGQLVGKELTYNDAIEAAKDYVEAANRPPDIGAPEYARTDLLPETPAGQQTARARLEQNVTDAQARLDAAREQMAAAERMNEVVAARNAAAELEARQAAAREKVAAEIAARPDVEAQGRAYPADLPSLVEWWRQQPMPKGGDPWGQKRGQPFDVHQWAMSREELNAFRDETFGPMGARKGRDPWDEMLFELSMIDHPEKQHSAPAIKRADAALKKFGPQLTREQKSMVTDWIAQAKEMQKVASSKTIPGDEWEAIRKGEGKWAGRKELQREIDAQRDLRVALRAKALLEQGVDPQLVVSVTGNTPKAVAAALDMLAAEVAPAAPDVPTPVFNAEREAALDAVIKKQRGPKWGDPRKRYAEAYRLSYEGKGPDPERTDFKNVDGEPLAFMAEQAIRLDIQDVWRKYEPEYAAAEGTPESLPAAEFAAQFKSSEPEVSWDELAPIKKRMPRPGETSLAEQIASEGVKEPVIVSSDGYVVDGHHRVLAAIEHGQDVPFTRIAETAREWQEARLPSSVYRGRYAGETEAARQARLAEPTEEAPAVYGAETAFPNPRDVAGEDIPATFRLVELDELITSRDPGFDQGIQQRMSGQAREKLINTIANRPKYEMFFGAESGAEGTPLVGPDGMVIAGNHRVTGMRQMDAAKFDRYRELLAERAGEYGFTPEQVSAMNNPVLVREIPAEHMNPEMASALNAATGGMGATERAFDIAARLTGEDLALLDLGESVTLADGLLAEKNAPFVRAVLDKLTDAQREELTIKEGPAKGTLNAQAVSMIGNALLARVLPDPAVVARFVESPDPDLGRIRSGVLEALGQLAEADALITSGVRHPEVAVGDVLTEAIKRLIDMRQRGVKAEDVELELTGTAGFNLGSTVDDAIVGELAWALHNMTSIAEIRDFLRAYAKAVEGSPDPTQMGMFAEEPPTLADMLNKGARELNMQRLEKYNAALDTRKRRMQKEEAERGAGMFVDTEKPLVQPADIPGFTDATGTIPTHFVTAGDVQALARDVPVIESEGAAIAARAVPAARVVVDGGNPFNSDTFAGVERNVGEVLFRADNDNHAAALQSLFDDPQKALSIRRAIVQMSEARGTGPGEPGRVVLDNAFHEAAARLNEGTASGGDLLVLHYLSTVGMRFNEQGVFIGKMSPTKKLAQGAAGMEEPDLYHLWQARAYGVSYRAASNVELSPDDVVVVTSRARKPDPQFADAAGFVPDNAPEVAKAHAVADSGAQAFVKRGGSDDEAMRNVTGAAKTNPPDRMLEVNPPDEAKLLRLAQDRLDNAQARLTEQRAAMEAAAEVPPPARGIEPLSPELYQALVKYTQTPWLAKDPLAMGAVGEAPATLGQVTDVIESIDLGIPSLGAPMLPEEIGVLRAGLADWIERRLAGTEGVASKAERRSAEAVETARTARTLADTPEEFRQDVIDGFRGLEWIIKPDESGVPLTGWEGTQYDLTFLPKKSPEGGPLPPRVLPTQSLLARLEKLSPDLPDEIAMGRKQTVEARVGTANVAATIGGATPPIATPANRSSLRRALAAGRAGLEHMFGARPEKEMRTVMVDRYIDDLVGELTDMSDEGLDAWLAGRGQAAGTINALHEFMNRPENIRGKSIGMGVRLYRRESLIAPDTFDRVIREKLVKDAGGRGDDWAENFINKGIVDSEGANRLPEWVVQFTGRAQSDTPFWDAWRTADNRTRHFFADRPGKLSEVVERLYGSPRTLRASKLQRNLTFHYHFVRFMLDARWLALEKIEAPALVMFREGVGAVMESMGIEMQGLRPTKTGKVARPHFMGIDDLSNRRENYAWWLAITDPGLDIAYRMNYLLTLVKRSQVHDYPNVLRDMARRSPDIAQAMRAFGDTPDQWLNKLSQSWESYYALSRKISPEEAQATFQPRLADGTITKAEYESILKAAVDDEGFEHLSLPALEAEIAAGVANPVLAPLFNRLKFLNQQAWNDAAKLIYGQSDRSNAQRLLNHPLMYWPISYQIKAVKWLAGLLFERAFGVDSGAIGALTLENVHQAHMEQYVKDPDYRAYFKDNKNLLFFAQMFMPITPWDIGVSLSPFTQIAVSLAAQGAGADVDVPYARNLFSWGPSYTWFSLIPTVAFEQLKGAQPGSFQETVTELLGIPFPKTITVTPSRSEQVTAGQDVVKGVPYEEQPPVLPPNRYEGGPGP